MPSEERARRLLIGLAKGLALIAAAGAAGIAIGFGLSSLSGNNDPVAAPVGIDPTATTTSARPASTATVTTTTPRKATSATPTTLRTATTTAPTQTQTTTTASGSRLAQVDVRVLGAVLRPEGAPSGDTPQDGEIVMRVRAENRGSATVTLDPPVLRIGSVRAEVDPDTLTPETQFGPLAAGASKAVTFKFQITGEATPKATRDRRARIEIAGRSEALRIKVADG